jgi:hypothetical protein
MAQSTENESTRSLSFSRKLCFFFSRLHGSERCCKGHGTGCTSFFSASESSSRYFCGVGVFSFSVSYASVRNNLKLREMQERATKTSKTLAKILVP